MRNEILFSYLLKKDSSVHNSEFFQSLCEVEPASHVDDPWVSHQPNRSIHIYEVSHFSSPLPGTTLENYVEAIFIGAPFTSIIIPCD